MSALRWCGRRVVDLAYITALLLFAFGCAGPVHVEAPVTKLAPPDTALTPVDTIINHVLVDSATADWLAKYRLRLDVEDTICAYGFIRADSAFVAMLRPTRTYNASPAIVWYDTCPILNPDYFGKLMWLGGWHNHGPVFPGLDCDFSPLDDKSFFEQRAFIDLISCSQGLIARGRKHSPQSR